MNVPRWLLLAVVLFFSLGAMAQHSAHAPQPALHNPLLPVGPDPWVEYKDGFYYYMNTTETDLTLWKTASMAELKSSSKEVVWRPPATGPYSHDIWAPEIHFIEGRWYIYFAADEGRWYIYFAADEGSNLSHRIFVLESSSSDPLQGSWQMKGKVADPSDKWAIDASVFEDKGRWYMIWSGWEGDENGTQNIYIARLANAWTIEGVRTRLSTPEYPWEKVGDVPPQLLPGNPPHIDVNEGPEVLKHKDKIFLTYSASACWTDDYSLGMLTAVSGSNLLDRNSWTKSTLPVFQQSRPAHVYATGHNSFFKSPDGRDWILYHANAAPGQGCGHHRSPRAQPFTWKPDGTPYFGTPLPTRVSLAWSSMSGQ